MRWVLLALLVMFASATSAQEAKVCEAINGVEQSVECLEVAKLRNQVEVLKKLVNEADKKLSKAKGVMDPWSKLDFEYLRDWYDHNRKLMKETERAFDWQDKATNQIHVLVMVLISIAAAVSVLEIVYGLFLHKNSGGTQELELSADKIKMVTTISGFALLLITFAFFYVYVQEVYDLKPIGMTEPEDRTTASSK